MADVTAPGFLHTRPVPKLRFWPRIILAVDGARRDEPLGIAPEHNFNVGSAFPIAISSEYAPCGTGTRSGPTLVDRSWGGLGCGPCISNAHSSPSDRVDCAGVFSVQKAAPPRPAVPERHVADNTVVAALDLYAPTFHKRGGAYLLHGLPSVATRNGKFGRVGPRRVAQSRRNGAQPCTAARIRYRCGGEPPFRAHHRSRSVGRGAEAGQTIGPSPVPGRSRGHGGDAPAVSLHSGSAPMPSPPSAHSHGLLDRGEANLGIGMWGVEEPSDFRPGGRNCGDRDTRRRRTVPGCLKCCWKHGLHPGALRALPLRIG